MASWSRSKSGSSGYVETEFQKAVCKLTFEEFVDRTNIREIVENGFQKAALERNICNAAISAEQLKEYMKHYYDRRHKTRRWQSSELKNLKWKSAAVKSESAQSTVIAQSTISDANGDTVEPVEGRQRRKSVERQSKEIVDTQVRIKLTDKAEVSKEQAKASNVVAAKKTDKSVAAEVDDACIITGEMREQNDWSKPAASIFEPSDFQTEIIALNFDAFVAKTNIGDIAQHEVKCRSEKTKRPATTERIDARIKYYYEKRYCIDQWWVCGLKNLRYKWWQNQPQSSADAVIQTHRVDLKDASTQCELDHDIFVPIAELDNVMLLSQSTQTQETRGDEPNPMDRSDGRNALPEQCVTLTDPEAEHEQQRLEPIEMEIAIDDLVAEATEVHTVNAEANESTKNDDSADENQDVEMLSVAEANANGETADQPISDTNELDTENMFEEVANKKSADIRISDRFVKSTPTEKQHNLLKRQASMKDLETTDDIENTDPNHGPKPGPKSQKRVHLTNYDDEAMTSFNENGSPEQSDTETTHAGNDPLKLTQDLANILNADNSSTQLPGECDELSAKADPSMDVDGGAINEPLFLTEPSKSNDFFLALSNGQGSKCATFEKSNSNDDDFEAAQPPLKKKKLVDAEHSYAEPPNVNKDAETCSASHREGVICVASSPVQPRAEFMFKIPQSDHHEFLCRFNFENTLRRLTVGARTSTAAAINCEKQIKQQKILRLDANTVHRVKLYGEGPEKLLQLKCKSWREVQCLLEVVKNYAYKLNVSEPPARSILGRVLYHFFVKSSTFTSVHIENVQKDRSEVTAAFVLKPKQHRRDASALDPFYLNKFSYDLKKTQMR